ncbi:MAG: ABC transporter permease, partial [Bacteroidota bacterium]
DVFVGKEWKKLNYEKVIFPPIPYAPSGLDLANANFKSPFGPQKVQRKRFWHLLGTDSLGRDVASGLIHGIRIALLIGFGSMFLSLIIGLPLGLIAGYFGDNYPVPWWIAAMNFIFGLLFILYVFVFASINDASIWMRFVIAFIFIIIIFGFNRLVHNRVNTSHSSLNISWDLIIMRGIEIFRSIPVLFIFLALLAIIKKPTAIHIVFIIGCLQWPSIARFVRAEVLGIRNENYISMAKSVGLSEFRIITKHILPNAIGPALIVAAFGFASAILIESTLSFLGLGLGADQITWGSMLKNARNNFNAWWLAIFPGLAIFISIYIFNKLGDALNER